VCEQLAQGCYLKARGRESNPRPFESQVQLPDHYAIRPSSVTGESRYDTDQLKSGAISAGVEMSLVKTAIDADCRICSGSEFHT